MEERRYHIVIASIVFAILMWFSINMGYEYTVTKQIPIAIENIADGKALKYPLPKRITVRFKGHGWQLAALYLSPALRYQIDLSTMGPEGFILTSGDLNEHVTLPVAIQTLDVKPDTLILALDDYTEKHIPIIANHVTTFREGFGQVGPSRLTPDSAIIGGAGHLVRSLTEWRTEYRKFEGARQPIDVDIPLEESGNYALDVFPAAVRLQIDIQPFAEKTFPGVALTARAVPSNREVIFIPPKMDIIVRGGIDQLAHLRLNEFQATVDYEKLLEDTTGIVIPRLTAPKEIRIIRRTPERFQFIIRKKL